MANLAQYLRWIATDYIVNPVLDRTGLEGSWDFSIKWSARVQLASSGSDGIPLPTAIDKQLGLKLELRSLPMDVIAIDLPGVTEKLPSGPTEFEVAVIKPSDPKSNDRGFRPQPGGRVNIQGITLKDLITLAWNISPDMLVGAPKWLDSDRFDIIAQAPSTESKAIVEIDELRPMLRTLLADRFKLAMHNEDQPVSVYALTVGRREPKLAKADPSHLAQCKSTPPPAETLAKSPLTAVWTCENMSMSLLAVRLREMAPAYVDHMIVDATGLEGGWNFSLAWTPLGQLRQLQAAASKGADGVPTADPNGGLSLFEAVDKQLGLKLEMQKKTMSVMVIDKVDEKPTDN